jgi:hypothetical protein
MLSTLFIYSAIIGGAVLVVQLALMLLGFMSDDLSLPDIPIDDDTPDIAGAIGESGDNPLGWFYEVLSIRTLSAAATFFGLTGLTAQAYGASAPAAATYASAAGFAGLYSVYWLFKQLGRLESSGNENISNALDRPARVYVAIPAQAHGAGKVQMEMQGRVVEYQAITDEPQRLASGEEVVVVEIISSDTVRVVRSAPVSA